MIEVDIRLIEVDPAEKLVRTCPGERVRYSNCRKISLRNSSCTSSENLLSSSMASRYANTGTRETWRP